jgi:hypothetical protein
MTTKMTPNFRRVAEGAGKDLLLKPLVRAKLNGGTWPEFTTRVRGSNAKQDASHIDGWFHPSTHPTMGERQLYYYLTEPENWNPEPFSVESRISMTMGTMMHDFMETVMLDADLLIRPQGNCINCKRPHGKGKGKCPEHGAIDPVLKSRGHMDGLVHPRIKEQTGFEYKTSVMTSLRTVDDLDTDAYRAKWPYYYAQNQEYMRMTGLRDFIVLFQGVGTPWEMREFHVPFDIEYSMGIERKYKSVRDHVAAGVVPQEPCDGCKPRGKMARECGATNCLIKKIS